MRAEVEIVRDGKGGAVTAVVCAWRWAAHHLQGGVCRVVRRPAPLLAPRKMPPSSLHPRPPAHWWAQYMRDSPTLPRTSLSRRRTHTLPLDP